MLWLPGALLVALALAFVLWPLWRGARRPAAPGERRELMRALYRDRLTELEREARAGQVDAGMRSEVERELGASLLDEYREAQRGAHRARRPDSQHGGAARRYAPWLLAALVPALAAGIYLSVGEPDAGAIAGAAEVLRLDPEQDRTRIEAWRDVLEQRVAKRPEDAQSWYLLGVARLQLGTFGAAADAFASASERVGPDPNVDLYWLQARYLASQGEIDERSRALAERVLDARPNHPLVLEMLAIEAYRRGDYRAAVEHLNRALGNDLAPPQFAALLAGLEQARSRMEPLTPSVDVAVSAAAPVPQDATLFVIARPPGGGMPYAVVRRPAGLLPTEVRLDDTTSMSPDRGLSAADAFEVVVRLSLSGTAAAAPGDWEWQSPVLEPDDPDGPLELEAVLAPPAPGGG